MHGISTILYNILYVSPYLYFAKKLGLSYILTIHQVLSTEAMDLLQKVGQTLTIYLKFENNKYF